jgi:hypothetical protein
LALSGARTAEYPEGARLVRLEIVHFGFDFYSDPD